MNRFQTILSGGDLRSIGLGSSVVACIENQKDFDELFNCLFDLERIIVMRAADAVEKVTRNHFEYLPSHKSEILEFLNSAGYIEFKWHLAQLVARLELSPKELQFAWNKLAEWVKESSESRIVRVNALQSLYNLSKRDSKKLEQLHQIMRLIERENIPSLNARIRKLKKPSANK